MLEDYKKNDPRLWLYRSKYFRIIFLIFIVVVLVSIIYEKLIM